MGITIHESRPAAKDLGDRGRVFKAGSWVESILHQFKQANLLIDARTNEMLRKVLANVRAQEKFDAGVTKDVPHLIGYFQSNAPSRNKTEA